MEQTPPDSKFESATPACYGCVFACTGTTISCNHPLSLRISFDGFTRKSYRFPSFYLCISNKGLCNFYEPSPIRGAEYNYMKEDEEQKKKDVELLDKVLDNAKNMTPDALRAALEVAVGSMGEKEDDV